MALLADHGGDWTGSNKFRLMPADDAAEFPAAATVSVDDTGHLTAVSYSWRHPADGEQRGLVVLTQPAADSVVAMWTDTWHQQPHTMALGGTVSSSGIELVGSYAETWEWRIVFDTSHARVLYLRMDNVVPQDHASDTVPAGPYAAMDAELRRA